MTGRMKNASGFEKYFLQIRQLTRVSALPTGKLDLD